MISDFFYPFFSQTDATIITLLGSFTAKLHGMSANAAFLFYYMHMISIISQRKGGTDTGNSTTNNNGLILVVQGLNLPMLTSSILFGNLAITPMDIYPTSKMDSDGLILCVEILILISRKH
jgi:hypothetical protein